MHKDIIEHDVYQKQEFMARFGQDIEAARSHIVLKSPFLSEFRLMELKEPLRSAKKRGVVICAYLKEPENATEQSSAKFNSSVELLREWGLHVNLQKEFHEKVAIIDGRITWDGSFNMMSQNRMTERMTRTVSELMVLQAIAMHQLDSCTHCKDTQGVSLLQKNTYEAQRAVLGKTLELRRKQLEIGQKELANQASTSQAAVSEIEGTLVDVRLSTLIKICDGLGMRLLPVPWWHYATARDHLNLCVPSRKIVRERRIRLTL